MISVLWALIHIIGTSGMADDSVVTSDDTNGRALEEIYLIDHPFPICDFQPNHTGSQKKTLNSKMPLHDEDGVQSTQFLKDLQTKILESLKKELAYSNRVIGCYQSTNLDAPDPSCKDAFTFDYANLEEVGCEENTKIKSMSLFQLVSIARRSLAIANSTSTLTAARVVLPQLKHPRVSKEVAWDPLNGSELKQAQELYDKYIRIAEKERISDSNPFTTATNERLAERRETALRVYREIMDQNPILQFIHSPTPDRNELINAAKRIKERATEEINRIESMSAYWTKGTHKPPPGKRRRKSGGSNGFNPKALALIEYETITEQLLASKPEYCSVLKMALDANSRNERNKDNAILVGTSALGFVTAGIGTAVAVFGGLGVGVGMAGSEVYTAYKADQLNRKTATVSIKNKCGAFTRSNQTTTDKEREELLSRTIEAPIVSVAGAGTGSALRVMARQVSRRGSKLYHLIKKDK